MKDLLTQDGKPESDLSKRMADNVVQAMVGYMQAPSATTAEMVHAYSTALSSLSLLAIAEQLQTLNELMQATDSRDSLDMSAEIWGGS